MLLSPLVPCVGTVYGFGIGLIATGLFLTLLALLYWLLQTTSGRDALLAQVVTRLPAATALTWDRAEGAVAGPLTLHNIEFRYQDIHFRAARLRMDPDIWRLLLLGCVLMYWK